jgi:DNA-3-methyladenine glycosylase
VTSAPWLSDDVLEVATALLGWRLVSDLGGERVVAELVEVEAYAGETDPASHAYRGRSPRNGSMFGPPGTLYVYRSYGIHWCMNVVSGEPGVARAVLLRGAEIVEGAEIASRRRGRADHLADGPGKLTQALGVTDSMIGHDLAQAPLRLVGPRRVVKSFVTGPRVGISRAKDRPWRFVADAWED